MDQEKLKSEIDALLPDATVLDSWRVSTIISHLSEKFGLDLTSQKKAIKQFVQARVDDLTNGKGEGEGNFDDKTDHGEISAANVFEKSSGKAEDDEDQDGASVAEAKSSGGEEDQEDAREARGRKSLEGTRKRKRESEVENQVRRTKNFSCTYRAAGAWWIRSTCSCHQVRTWDSLN